MAVGRSVEMTKSVNRRAVLRAGGGFVVVTLLAPDAAAGAFDAVAAAVRSALEGRIPALWVERYLAERIEPLREELAVADARVRALDPAGWAARIGQPQ
ncbi:MAG: hypothetical protein QHJ73_02240, partial [Armatimonadota bacterium]|nr:hypothetical protein [Armatimonadota bacterium]